MAGVLATKWSILKGWEIVEDNLRSGAREGLARTYAEAYGDEWLASVSNVGFSLGEIRHLQNKLWVNVSDADGHDDHHEAH